MTLLHKTKRAAQLLFLFMTTITLIACTREEKQHFKLSGTSMGTSYHITLVENSAVEVTLQELKAAIDQQLTLINQQMSTYDPVSELSKINQMPVGQWISVSQNVFEVFSLSLELAWLSDGAFDITIGPLVNLWGFGPDNKVKEYKIPHSSTIANLINQTGFEQLEFDIVAQSVLKKGPVKLDLSAIAKGYAVDKLADLLILAGFSDFMVELGGELRVVGLSPRGTPWRIAIEQPDPSLVGQIFNGVDVTNVGIATSGDYRNYFEQNGKRYSHTINPVSGYPIAHALASVTVIADTAAYADGLATAINVMGPQAGLAFANQHNFAIYMIVKTDHGFKASYSKAFESYLVH